MHSDKSNRNRSGEKFKSPRPRRPRGGRSFLDLLEKLVPELEINRRRSRPQNYELDEAPNDIFCATACVTARTPEGNSHDGHGEAPKWRFRSSGNLRWREPRRMHTYVRACVSSSDQIPLTGSAAL